MSTGLPEDDQPVSSSRRPRPWLTATLTLLIFGVHLIVQSAVVGAFLAIELQQDPELDADAWFEQAMYNGKLVAVSTIVAAAATLPMIPLAARWVSRGAIAEHLGLRIPCVKSVAFWMIVLAAYLGSVHVVNLAAGRDQIPEFVRGIYESAGLSAPLLIAIVIVAPISEELFFRGLLYGGLAPSALRPVGAAVVSAFAWAVIHVQYDLFIIVSIFLAGLLFAAARQATGSVVLSMLLHAAMNLAACVELAIVME